MTLFSFTDKALTTEQLYRALKRHRVTEQYFHGVFALDTLPREIPIGKACVFNTAPSTHPGEHWLVVYRQNERELFYFDSMGVLEPPEIFNKYVVHWDKRRYQGLSVFCGHYCLIYILSIYLPGVMDRFTHHLTFNDGVVKLLARREFGV